MNQIETLYKNKEYEKLSKFLFDKEQEDVKNKIYWNKSYKFTFTYKNLEFIEKIFKKTNNKQLIKKLSLILWLFHQHAFQGIISNSKEAIRDKYDGKKLIYFAKRSLKYYKSYWRRINKENIFPLLMIQFAKGNLKRFKEILEGNEGKDKTWTSSNKLVKNMNKEIIRNMGRTPRNL